MTFEQLRVFLAVADELHMTRAADHLHMTQSAVSASVAALEAACGVRLFHRIGRRITLTEAGESFRPEAQAILARVAQAETVLADLSGLKRGHLALHASQTIANYWLGPLLHRFHGRHPEITLEVTIGNTAQVAAAVREGGADLGFVEGDVDAELLAKTALPGDRLMLVVATDHPWGRGETVRPGDLLDVPFVLREAGSGTRQIFEQSLARQGIDPRRLKVALELPSNEAVISAVSAGAGATVISELVAAAGLAAGALRFVPLAFPARRFYVLRHGDRYRSRAAEALLALLREPAGKAGGAAVGEEADGARATSAPR